MILLDMDWIYDKYMLDIHDQLVVIQLIFAQAGLIKCGA